MLSPDYRPEDRSEVRRVELTGEIDIYRTAEVDGALVSVENADLAIVDLAKVTYFDLTLINGLVRLRRRMSARRQDSIVRIDGATAHLRRILEVTNLASVFELSSSREPSQSSRNGSPCPFSVAGS